MIISRYLMKEILTSLLGVTFVLLLVLLSQQLVHFLGYAASGKIATRILLQLLGFQIPFLLAFLLPLGLFLGIILSYGHLYTDNELRVLQACGFSPHQLLTVTMIFSLVIVMLVAMLTLEVNPFISGQKEKLLAGANSDNVLDTLIPGRFQVSGDGKRVVYVEKISRNRKQADNIFIAEEKTTPNSSATPWTVLSAKSGFQMQDKVTAQRFVVAKAGYRYEGVPGQNDYKVVGFQQYAVRIPDMNIDTSRFDHDTLSTLTLLKTFHDPDHAAELQWRLSIPLSAFLLALMAVPLSRVKPRQGRYAILFPALLIYIIYMNLLFAGRSLIEQKTLSVDIGMWWIHGLALLAVIVLMRVRGV